MTPATSPAPAPADASGTCVPVSVEKSTVGNIPRGSMRSVSTPPSVGVRSTAMGVTMRCLQIGLDPGSAVVRIGMARLLLMVIVPSNG